MTACPFLAAVARDDLDEAHRLADADGDPCEPAVLAELVDAARRVNAGGAPFPAPR